MNSKLKKRNTFSYGKVKLYADENEYCELYENYNPEVVEQVINVIGRVEIGTFDWDLAVWYWENYRELFFANLLTGCFSI